MDGPASRAGLLLPGQVQNRGQERGAQGHELMLGEDGSHLDFRASVLVDEDSVTLATAVRLHNTRGRLYSAVVRRVHPYMARRALRRAHRRVAFAARPAGERNARAAL
ncbi:DUF2867 domain-containing protein [Streptomyces sp. NPDC006458]|uniref:DUF2867 domain-containing protein n=1 Tax=Streptomyces sp. NPDC006458 TaxID=3154302 RepID=UPI0033A782D5